MKNQNWSKMAMDREARERTAEQAEVHNRCSAKRITTTIMRFSLFWDVTLLRLAVTDVSGQRTGPPTWTALLLKKGPTACPKTSVITKPRCVTSQKSEDLAYTAQEA
jgi:hypothetical protein